MVALPNKPQFDFSLEKPKIQLTGTLTVYFQNEALLKKYLASIDPTATIDGSPAPKWVVDWLRKEGFIE